MSRTCDYSDVPPAPTAEDIMTLQLKLFELESRLNTNGSERSLDGFDSHSESMSHSSHTPQLLPREPLWEASTSNSNFPPTVFLDGELFRRAGTYIPRPLYTIPTVSVYGPFNNSLRCRRCTVIYFNKSTLRLVLYPRRHENLLPAAIPA